MAPVVKLREHTRRGLAGGAELDGVGDCERPVESRSGKEQPVAMGCGEARRNGSVVATAT